MWQELSTIDLEIKNTKISLIYGSSCVNRSDILLLVNSLSTESKGAEHMEQRLSGSGSTGAHEAAAFSECREQLCWSTWSSSFTGSDTVATMKHTEQQLSGSTETSSNRAHGAAVLWEQINQLHWITCSSCILEAWLLNVLQWSCCSWCFGKELLSVKALSVHRKQLLYNPYALLPCFVL